jgi:DNA/RNA-binding domain of Phe-tRNA-synthetase-like protein
MRFSVDEKLFQMFPGLTIGVVVCSVNNTWYGNDGLEGVLEELRAGFPYEKPQDHPHVRVWREGFTRLGVSASKYYSSIESLLRRALKGGPFPRINPLVDLYNAVSLKYLVPMGGHAIAPLTGDMALCFAQGGEPFTPMDGGGQESAEKGEVTYRDDEEVLTRRWVWRQCEKDKVTAHTTSVFIPIDVMGGLAPGLCQDVIASFEEGLTKNSYGSITHRDMLTAQHPVTEFSAP